MKKSKVIAFVPVRGGSKSIPLKNIKLLLNKPLVYWCLKALEDTAEVDQVIVATDSIDIKQVVLNFGFNKVIIYDRKEENSRDHSTTESVVLEFLETKDEICGDDIFMLVQATSPLVSKGDFKGAIQMLKKRNFDSIVSGVRTYNFYWNFKDNKPLNYNYLERPRRQDHDGVFQENGAFYLSKVRDIVKTKNRISGNIGLYEMPSYTSYEIDEDYDWTVVENLMKEFIGNVESNYFKKELKLFISDVDGVLTDSGMYYSENGDELKKFNTKDGMAFQLLRESGISTAIITSENTTLVENRAKKLKIDYLHQGKGFGGKLEAALKITNKLGIGLDNVAYIGDDLNCFELLSKVGFKACPNDASYRIKSIPGIKVLNKKGGEGVVREFVELLLY